MLRIFLRNNNNSFFFSKKNPKNKNVRIQYKFSYLQLFVNLGKMSKNNKYL